MKTLFTSLLILGLLAPAFSQRSFILSNSDRRGFLNISMGAAMPIGTPLYKNEINDPLSLMPQQGKAIQVSMGYRLNHRFGVMGQVSNCINAADATMLIENAKQGGLGNNFKANIGDWNCSFLTAGPYVSYTAGLWTFDGRVLGGYSLVQKPSTLLQGDYYNTSASVEMTSGKSQTFTMGAGTSVRFKIGRNFALALHADYLTTKANFKNVTTTLNIDKDQVSNTKQEFMGIGSLNLNGGLSFLF